MNNLSILNLPDSVSITLTIGDLKEFIKKSFPNPEPPRSRESWTKTYYDLKKLLPLPEDLKKEFRKKYRKNLANGDYKLVLYGLLELGIKDSETLKSTIIAYGGPQGLKGYKWFEKQYRIELLTELIKDHVY